MSNDSTVDVEVRPSAFTFVSTVASVSLMFVPYENVATSLDRRRHLRRDVLGAGARERRDDDHNRELDVGQQFLLE